MLTPFREDWHAFPCKLWEGRKNWGGYGALFNRKAVSQLIHRRTWIEQVGPIPDGYVCMHACDTPACYAIEHLGIGTQPENCIDMHTKGRGDISGLIIQQAQVLSVDDIIDIKTLLSLKVPRSEIMGKYNISTSHISNIKAGRKWAHVKIGCEF